MTDRDYQAWRIMILLTVIVLANVTLFEDGSIQLFNMTGWGFCFLPGWGC